MELGKLQLVTTPWKTDRPVCTGWFGPEKVSNHPSPSDLQGRATGS